MKKRKLNQSTIILIIIFLVGLAILLYPTISQLWNSQIQSKAVSDYKETVANLDETDYEKLFIEAKTYNKTLDEINNPFVNHEQVSNYKKVLDITDTGIMGYITIEKIKVKLPIYHGTTDAVLNIGSGHLEGSSLPVGGESTHSIITGHRGLPSSKLFTDLDKLELGNVFTVTVLNKVLTYEVDQILTVEPDEVDPLAIIEGEDYCTLMTCTPYGINSHRLLVRGTRTEATNPGIHVTPDAYVIDPLIVRSIVVALMLFVLLMILLVKYRIKKD